MKIPEHSVKESLKIANELLKKRRKFNPRDFVPGRVFLGRYTPKHKDLVHDKRPLVLILRVNSVHTLGLNLHWIPYTFRIKLVRTILEKNKNNILKGKSIDFKYTDLRPLLKNPGYRKCVRLYCNVGFSKFGVLVPPEHLLDMARLNAAIFSRKVKL